MNEEVSKILSDMAQEQTAVETDTAPSGQVPLTTNRKHKQVEIIPGIMVSQVLIDEAVRRTTTPYSLLPSSTEEALEEARERDRERRAKESAELREDIDKSREVVFAMVQRMRDPLKYDEKFISYDTMPPPLQRVVKAYIDAEAANRELNEAVASLSKDLTPPVVQVAKVA